MICPRYRTTVIIDYKESYDFDDQVFLEEGDIYWLGIPCIISDKSVSFTREEISHTVLSYFITTTYKLVTRANGKEKKA